jgi:hypothetical protein
MINLDGYEFHIQWILDNIISYIYHIIQIFFLFTRLANEYMFFNFAIFMET